MIYTCFINDLFYPCTTFHYIPTLNPHPRSAARCWREPRVDFQVSKGSPTPFLRFTEGDWDDHHGRPGGSSQGSTLW